MAARKRFWHTTLLVGAVLGAYALPAQALEVTPAPVVATPSPAKSPGSLPPLLPPEGLPTAPPPDAIKPVVPQAQGLPPAGDV
jgi:hypothetical protein